MTRFVCVLGLVAGLLVPAAHAANPLPRQLCGAKIEVAEVVTPKENPERTAYLGDWVTIYICHQSAFTLEAAEQQRTSPSS